MAGAGGQRSSLKWRVAACSAVLIIIQTAASANTLAPRHDASADRMSSVFQAADDLRVRKNVKTLTAQERHDFVEAVLTLKSVPSPYDAGLSYYDQFVAWHFSLYPCGIGHEMIRPHGGPMFLPWHRQYLLHFEDALRDVSGKPITVPYWDWSDPSSTASVFANDFMGGDGDPNDGYALTTGPFRKAAWTLKVHPYGLMWAASASDNITRRFASFPVPGFQGLPTPEDIVFALGRPRYDVAPYDANSDPNVSFRNAVEGFWQKIGPVRVPFGGMACGPDGVMMAASGPGIHNLAHAWVGGFLGVGPSGPKVGTMLLPTSPNDPVFWLHHANIDRLWAEWQEIHGVDTYEPASCHGLLKLGCAANTSADPMHPPFESTPDDVADVRGLGYRYETMDTGTGISASQRKASAASGLLFRCELRASPARSTPLL